MSQNGAQSPLAWLFLNGAYHLLISMESPYLNVPEWSIESSNHTFPEQIMESYNLTVPERSMESFNLTVSERSMDKAKHGFSAPGNKMY